MGNLIIGDHSYGSPIRRGEGNTVTITEKYREKCNTPSDINELLPFLKEYAEKCEHITEMGVRNPTSTYAFLAARPKKLISYDIGRYPEVDLAGELEKAEGIDFTFILQDVLKADIEETDMCFIDTFHCAEQLRRELERHSGKVKKFIAFHDTTTFWEVGESGYDSVADKGTNCGRGLRYALEPFLAKNTQWSIVFKTEINNGLTVIQRNG